MKVDLHDVGRHLASLVWVAVKSFAGTLAVFTLAGGVLAAASYYFLRDHPVYAAVGAAVAVAEGIITEVVLGVKRAGVLSVAHGLGRLRLGRSLVQLVFDRILKVADTEATSVIGERGGRLVQADERLTEAVHGLAGDSEGGWVRRTLRAKLLGMVHRYTLARFRQEGAAHGGVDLLKVRTELEDTIDDTMVGRVRGGLTVWTVLTVIGLPFVVAVQTWVAILLLNAK